jgi:hypothetical protein
MANTTADLVSLDFNTIKDNLKTYLRRSNSPFKDYDFEGSNMASMLDVLAYNTYLNSFYLNMISREMFLDTAQLRDSVVSHSKELNYVPRSYRSSEADINFTVTPSSVTTTQLIIPRGQTFTSRIGSNTFTFSTEENKVVSINSNGVFDIDLTIYEGTYLTESFVYVSSNNTQRFVLSNPTVDTRSLLVTVYENNGANAITYTKASSFLGLNANSKVYFLQGAENEQYELIFGDDVISRRPKNGATVVVEYRISSGELANGSDLFDIDSSIQGENNISDIITTKSAYNGAINETVASIKFNAPRYYQNQDRAVTTSDYENLLRSNFPVISAVSAFGGEELDPPQYGKVYISVDVNNADGTPQGLKDELYNFIKPRSPLSIDPVFIDPEYLFLEVDTNVRYGINQTSLKLSDIKTLVTSAVSQFNADYLNDFKKTLRFSRFVEAIDAAHFSIISNDTFIRPFKTIVPSLSQAANYTINYGFQLSNFNNSTPFNLPNEVSAITSSYFTYNNRQCLIEDDGLGILNIVSLVNNSHQIVRQVGTVNYTSGVINLNGFIVDSYEGEGVRIFVDALTKDIFSTKNVILEIRDADINVTVEAIRA